MGQVEEEEWIHSQASLEISALDFLTETKGKEKLRKELILLWTFSSHLKNFIVGILLRYKKCTTILRYCSKKIYFYCILYR